MRLHLGSLTRLYTALGGVDPDPQVVRMAVLAWQRALNKLLPAPLNWDESPTAPFAGLDVGEQAWSLLAAHPQVSQPGLWLPGDHDLLFQAETLAGWPLWVGSVAELAAAIPGEKALPPEAQAELRALQSLCRRSQDFGLPLARLEAFGGA